MRKLYLSNGDKQFKFGDTETEINLNAYDNGSAATLTADAKVRIKNDSGYLLEVSASIADSYASITSGQLAQLPAGSYLLELWDTVDGGTAIYPSDGFLALQINDNVTGLSGGIVSSITVDDFIKQFSDLSQQLKQETADAVANGLKGDKGETGLKGDKGDKGDIGETGAQGLKGDKGDKGDKGEKGDKGDTGSLGPQGPKGDIGSQGPKGDTGPVGPQGPKGDKGDTGTVDNDGLIGTPAFQSLQTQVDNSAVGTNLLLGTGNNLSITGTNSLNQTMNSYLLTNGYSISSLASVFGKQFTIGFDWSVSGSSPSGSFSVQWDSKPWDLTSARIPVSSSNASGHFSYTFSVSTNSTNAATRIGFRLDNFVGTFTVSNIKLEKGTTATDWCPNPSEILTQSDYAKIKAAIVALGGTLS